MKTIVHLSDLHFGAELTQLAAALREDILARPPSLVVISGDLTQRARGSQFLAAQAYLKTLPGPQLAIPGNHDIPLYDVLRRFAAPLARYRRYIATDVDPTFVDDELFVAGINTARSLTWKSGRISERQIATLKTRLERTRARFKVVVTHHPFIPPPLDSSSDARIDLVGRATQALSILDAGRVDVLLAGHLHHGYSGDVRTHYPAAKRAIVCAQAGTAISHRVRGIEPNGYNRIVLDADTIQIEVRTWKESAFVTLRTVGYRRIDDGWQAVARESL